MVGELQLLVGKLISQCTNAVQLALQCGNVIGLHGVGELLQLYARNACEFLPLHALLALLCRQIQHLVGLVSAQSQFHTIALQ